MKLGSVYAGCLFQNNNTDSVGNQDGKEENKGSVKNGVIFAGNLKTMDQTSPLARKEKAQKEAIKTILEKFAGEQEIDSSVEEMKQKNEELTREAAEYKGQMDDLRANKEALKEEYGIAEDSDEQKNLELLEKSMDNPESITDDEWEQLKGMGPLTDYQKEALHYKGMIDEYKDRYDKALDQRKGINSSIENVKQARLKTHPMVDAQREAAEIIKNASKEVINGLMGEAKDKIDEDMEAAKEKQEELAAKKKEEEERTESAKNPDEQTAVDKETMKEVSSAQDTLDRELKQIIKMNELLEEDLKGAVVDQAL